MNLRQLLSSGETIILDGAMGTMLQESGLKAGEHPCLYAFKNPEAVFNIHKSYAEAGARIICANTFEANRIKMRGSGYTVEQIVNHAVGLAKSAAGSSSFVALDVGPVGELLAPSGSLAFEECTDIFKEVITCGEAAGADLIFIETVFDLYELKAALLAAKEASVLPVFASMTFQENARTFTGCPASAFAVFLDSFGADAAGVNCSVGPAQLYDTVSEIAAHTTLPIFVKPNAGLPRPDKEELKYDVPPDEFADETEKLFSLGVTGFGGCCGTDPEYIRALSKRLAGRKALKNAVKRGKNPAVCSGTNTLILDSVKIIGERINPTGKPGLKQALANGDVNYVLKQAIEQEGAGADILDVNVGMPGIDEAAVMKKAVAGIQSVTGLPLQIDSSDPVCLEAALRIYNGKPIVNSVNGKEESLNRVLPLVKKYGAAVVGLCLDENGIPADARGRFEIAERILKKALEYGIKREDVFIDCLTLTVSAEPKGASETLSCLKMIKERLGLKTVLGVSNISFGLPDRDMLNRAFLSLAVGAGLDLPIVNPSSAQITDTVFACKALLLQDENCAGYVSRFAGRAKTAEVSPLLGADTSGGSLAAAVINGLPGEAERVVKAMLTSPSQDPAGIINAFIIPALDKAGDLFEKNMIFLPQLLQSANAAKAACDILNRRAAKTGVSISKGKILLATVKGDIHDIGKNIVKAVLENYGYEILDMGRDVAPEDIASAVRDNGIALAGLSALMTTTLENMRITIEMIKDIKPDCKVIVGGAVLTANYAEKIGADFYAGDAKSAVDCAKKVFG